MTTDYVPKETLGLAGEFAVASELCRRGIYAQLTLGNRKRTDILVDDEKGDMLRVQVKAKQKGQWPAVKGVAGPSIVLVLVDYEKKKLDERPDFYVLTPKDWRKFITAKIRKRRKDKRRKISVDAQGVPTYEGNFIGTAIRPNQVKKYKEKWGKILNALKRGP